MKRAVHASTRFLPAILFFHFCSSGRETLIASLKDESCCYIPPFTSILLFNTMLSCRLIFLLALTGASAFTTTLKGQETASRPSTALFDGDGTGGWGIGSSRKMTPEEFARGDRRAFDGYQMRERGDFMRQIKDDQDDLRKSEMAELLGVASIAGIRVKDPKDRLDKFEPEVFDDEEDDLDLSV
jgi:hypothetical protein